MNTSTTTLSQRFSLPRTAVRQVIFAVMALATMATAPRAAAQTYPNAFGATTLMPVSATPSIPLYPLNQNAEVGTPFSVNLVFAVSGSQPYGQGYGIDAQIKFDPTKLQVVSVAAAPSSPWTTPVANAPTGFDNVNGTLRYAATGGTKSNSAFAVATIVFQPIAAGTSTLYFQNVNEYLAGYGAFGVNGSSINGSVTATAVLPTQTLTILGGSGSPGQLAANVEYYNPATGEWQPTYLTGWHPWGFVPGTNSWINYKTSTGSDYGAGPTTNQTLWYLYRVRFTVPADAQDPKMTFSLKADNFAQVAINGVTAGGSPKYLNYTTYENVIEGQADQVNVDATFSQNVRVGENTITLNIGDWGGLNGFNFRIDLSMKSSQPLEIVPVETDKTAPVINAPSDIVAEATSAAGAAVSFTVTATDNKDGSVPVTASPASGSNFPLGVNAVGLAARDAAGNVATASFDVIVRDTIAPALTVPADVTAEATSAAGATVSYPAATATDAVGVASIAYSQASGSTFALGTSAVTVTAKDAAGNTSSGSFSVTVQDTTAPALTVPDNIVLEATSAAGAVADFAATATDAVGVTSISYSQAPGSTFALGTTTVTVVARDAAGNISSGSFTVTVQDTTAPVIASISNTAPTLWPPNHKMVAVRVNAGVTDAVGVTSLKIVSVTSSEPDNGLGDGDTAGDIQITGDLTVNLRAERSGKGSGRTYTITVEARDAAGNASTRTTTAYVPSSQGK